MSVFIDTSGLLAVLDKDDLHHARASRAWREILSSDDILVTTNYVIVETIALTQHRLGVEASRAFQEEIVPVLHVRWVDSKLHNAAMAILLAVARRKLSLVDCVSFELMRMEGIVSAFTFDRHFKEQGFICVPA
ncbi:type II toxin-antitoxin system VapC family toxin [Geobacter grbiciae]|uniref:type II toxin-antitoxin system VapC family toxin n=1 Tax=Geobacter grbiciae TaxID=155042 RepID=UPI001C01E598|nr:PIN domain-containing protein [Geobacter grbiciae]MBT1075478.1 PIN domain-containing protein [Geobacter grbiciae]